MAEVAAVRRLPKREEIPEVSRWRLEDIYESEQRWEEDFRKVSDGLKAVQGRQGTLRQSARHLLDCLSLRDQVEETYSRLAHYASRRLDENSTNTAAQGMRQRAQRLGVELSAAAAYIEPEILALPAETVERWVAEEAGLARYRHYLADLLRHKPHTLSPEMEQLLARARELAQVPEDVFDLFNDADLKFPVIEDEQGQPVELTKARAAKFLESRDRRVRRDAFLGLNRTYGSYRNTLAGLLGGSVRKDVFFAQVRRYPSALAGALHADNVPGTVYTNLIETVRSRAAVLRRYLRLRRRVLKLDELRLYDLFVPLVEEIRFDVPFEQAVEKVTTALAPLGEEYMGALRNGLAARWVDVYESEGKRGGAYCAGVYGVHPYILLNWQGTLNDVFTLAHEAGHALHDYYAYSTQPYLYAHPSIFVAEVASTLNEALLFRHLLDTAPDDATRIYLLNDYLEQIRGTMFLQTQFAEFEKIVHERAEQGEPLTPDVLSDIYRQILESYYGDEVVIDPEATVGWARIPHFYTPFYVYKYATGIAAATALSRRIVSEGEPAVRQYLDFLRAGRSDYPLEILRRAGVDLATAEPILQTLDVFEELLVEAGAADGLSAAGRRSLAFPAGVRIARREKGRKHGKSLPAPVAG